MVNHKRHIAGLILGLSVAPAFAAVPQTINYQGKLADASGNPLTGTYSFQFKLCFDATAGDGNCSTFAEIWSNNGGVGPSISVVNGIYNVAVGSFTAGGIPEALIENNAQLYLEVSVLAGAGAVSGCSPGNSSPSQCQTLSPREPLSSSLWAIHALSAEKLAVGTQIATMTASGFVSFPSGAAFVGPISASSAALTNTSGYGVVSSSGINVLAGGVTAPFFSGIVTWSELTGFPGACPNGQFVTQVGSGASFSCGTPSGGGAGAGPWTSLPGGVVELSSPVLGSTNVVVQSSLTVQGNAFSVGTSSFVVSNGNVGVGTANPLAALHIAGANAVLMSSGIAAVPGSAGVFVSSSLYVAGMLTANSISGTLSSNINANQVNAGPFNSGAYSFPGSATFVTSATVSGSAFSVGGSTLVVAGGSIGVGAAVPKAALDVEGTNAVLMSSGIATVAGNSGLFVSTSLFVNGVISGNGSGLTNVGGTLSGGTANDVALWSGANTLTTIPVLGSGGLIIGTGGLPSTGTISGTFPLAVVNGAGTISLSLQTVPAALLPSTVAYTSSLNIFTASQTIQGTNAVLVSSGIATVPGNAGLFVSTSLFVNGVITGNGSGLTGLPAGLSTTTVAASTMTWTGQNTFKNEVTILGSSLTVIGNAQGAYTMLVSTSASSSNLVVSTYGYVAIGGSNPMSPLDVKAGGGASGFVNLLSFSDNAFGPGSGGTFTMQKGYELYLDFTTSAVNGLSLVHGGLGVNAAGNANGIAVGSYQGGLGGIIVGTSYLSSSSGDGEIMVSSDVVIGASNNGLPGSQYGVSVLTVAGTASNYTAIISTSNVTLSPDFVVANSGNVGIGTTGPGAPLDVEAKNASGYSLKLSSGISMGGGTVSAAQVCLGASCNTTWPSGGTPGGGLGQVQYSNGSGGFLGAANLVYSGGNVGVSSATPNAMFVVGTATMIVTSAGNVGIGTPAPLAKLDVEGTNGSTYAILTSSSIHFNTAGTGIVWQDGSVSTTAAAGGAASQWQGANPIYFNGSVGVSTTSPFAGIFQVGNGTMTVLSNGNVGIGTSVPSQQLQITGNLALPATTASAGIIYLNGSPWIHAYSSNNFFAGGAGNLTMNTLGILQANNDTGVGYLALANLVSGRYNTAVGASALYNVQGGYVNGFLNGIANTAIGYQALSSVTSGFDNTGLGADALSFNQSGSANAGAGYSVMYYATGSSNTAMGFAAGEGTFGSSSYSQDALFGFQAGFGLTTGSNDVFLGSGAGSNENAGSNDIVIGANQNVAVPGAGNFLNIGGAIYGTGLGTAGLSVGISTQAPQAELEISSPTAVSASQLLIVSTGALASQRILSVLGGGGVGISTGNINNTLEVGGSINARQIFVNGVAVSTSSGGGASQWQGASGNPIYYNGSVGVSTGAAFAGLFEVGSGTLTVLQNGNVGVGTNAPQAPLHILAPANTTYALIIATGSVDATQRIVTISTGGVIYAQGGVTYAGDLAEMYPALDDARSGDIVMLSGSERGAAVKKAVAGLGAVLGVVSTKPGVTLGAEMGGGRSVAVALSGRVPVKISFENGPIRAGTMLAASDKPGVAARAAGSGQVIGFALEDAKPSSESQVPGSESNDRLGTRNSERGIVLCFVKPQYWVDPADYESLRRDVEELKARLGESK